MVVLYCTVGSIKENSVLPFRKALFGMDLSKTISRHDDEVALLSQG